MPLAGAGHKIKMSLGATSKRFSLRMWSLEYGTLRKQLKGDRGRPGERGGDRGRDPGITCVDGRTPGSRKKARWKSRKYQHLGDSPRGRGPGERLRVLQLYRGMICVPHNLSILSVWFEDF